jgi:hypothetical protein
MGKASFVLFNILCGLSYFTLGFSKGSNGILSQFGEGNNLSLMVGNFGFHIVGKLLTGGFIILMNSFLVLLLLVKGGGKVLKEEVYVVNGGTGGKGKLNKGED